MRNRTTLPIALLLGVSAVAMTPQASRGAEAVAQTAQAPTSNVPSTAGISLDIKPIVGSDALAVSGTAAAGNTITVTLYATYSRDIADVILSRRTIVADARGIYQAAVPIAPGFFRGSIITVVTKAMPSGASASARYTVAAPNITVPPDNLPQNMQR